MLSLSLVPYGISVDDNANTGSTNTVTIAGTAKVEAGVNNQALLHVEPLKLSGSNYTLPNNLLSSPGRRCGVDA